ncbi:MAG: hypothetical protein NT169_28260 [Chloroflexi bacterium]|nr:hypothetical protein [Chloroflexota bacterium]
MRKISDLIGQTLRWRPTGDDGAESHLCADGEPVAVLRFSDAFGATAIAESADGCWKISRPAAHKTRVIIADAGSDTEIAVLQSGGRDDAGTLQLPDGRRFQFTTNFLRTAYAFRSPQGFPVVRLKTGGVLRMLAEITLAPETHELSELPWMTMLGWYLAVMAHRDHGAAVSIVGPIK